MIYCVTQPLENYNVTIEGETVGLYMTYGHHPPLLNLILLMTLTPFGYERGTEIEPRKRIVQLKEEERFFNSLNMEVKDEKVSRIVSKLNPIEIYDDMKSVDLSHLPVCEYYKTGQEALKTIMAARAVAWAMNYRGLVKREGNLTTAVFGKEGIKVPVDMEKHYKEFVHALTKARNKNE